MRPFHLAFPVHDLAAARAFYGGLIGCEEGRSSPSWIDFNLYGHQIVAHLEMFSGEERKVEGLVDDQHVPVPHFGVLLDRPQWNELAARLKAREVEFVIEPCIRFQGQVGEQATMFFLDPSGNALEFKAFASDDDIFRS